MDIEDSRNRLDDLFSSGNNEKALQVAFAMLSTDGTQTSEVSGSSPPNITLLTFADVPHLDGGHAFYLEEKELFLKENKFQY